MARSTRSLPDWRGRWSCSQTSGVPAIASIVSGRRSLGCGLVKRTRPIPGMAPTARQQRREQGAAPRDVAAVGVDVLAQQRHLGHPPLGQQPHLGDDVVHRAAHLRTAHRRHDAERTGVVAARLDVHPRHVGQLTDRTGSEQRVGAQLGRRHVEDLHERALRPRAAQQPRCAREVVRAEHDVDPPDLLLDPLTVLLGQASADGDLQPGLRVDQLLQLPQCPVQPLIGVLPDAAGVQHHHVGVLHGNGRHQAVGHQQTGEPLGVVFVHLAPEGADEIGAGHPAKSREPGHLDFGRDPSRPARSQTCPLGSGRGTAREWRGAARARAVRSRTPPTPP